MAERVAAQGVPADLANRVASLDALFSGLNVIEVATALDVRMVLTLGALLAEIPHSRPVSVVGTATDQALVDRLGLRRSSYEGPTGIVGALGDGAPGT